MREAGVALVGGHSVEDDEPKYGLSVTGLVHPEKIMTNSALRTGDLIALTKAVGTGVLATATKAGLESPEAAEALERSICALNRVASEVALRHGVRACTDVTGFGLAGHLMEMARASGRRVRLFSDRVPLLEGVLEYASMGLIPGGAYANRSHFGPGITIGPNVSRERADLIFDPQTSGGLLLGVSPKRIDALLDDMKAEGVSRVAVIGEVVEADDAGSMEIV
jgi:selenide,water dikinase